VTTRRIVVIGAGGHAKVIIELLRSVGWEPCGMVAPTHLETDLFGLRVLGGDEILPRLRKDGISTACIALGDNAKRHDMAIKLLSLNFRLPAAIHPTAFISPSATIAAGVVVMAHAVVGTEASVDELAIINTNAIVEHDNRIGKAAHIAPGCALGGTVKVGALALVGVGSAVRPGIAIGERAIVGAGSAVVSDVPAGAVAAGVPAKIWRSIG
jgi:UDP-perosamine 4-acetyltransferase